MAGVNERRAWDIEKTTGEREREGELEMGAAEQIKAKLNGFAYFNERRR